LQARYTDGKKPGAIQARSHTKTMEAMLGLGKAMLGVGKAKLGLGNISIAETPAWLTNGSWSWRKRS